MVIHEYQGKVLLAKMGTPTPRGKVASTPAEAEAIARELGGRVVVKAQVHVGGRGKAGGVKLADNPADARKRAEEILGMTIKGLTVNKVLVEEAVEMEKEYYLGITLDRAAGANAIMFSPMGGVDIEEVAREHPDKIYKAHASPQRGLLDHQIRQLIYADPEMSAERRRQLAKFIRTLYELYIKLDCTLAEINPLAVLKDGRMVAADAKVNFDENALFRHKELEDMLEISEEDPLERRAKEEGLAYVHLDGEVGIIGNGAGLVMGTLDTVSRVGGKPANFLDVGGGASAAVVEKALNLVLSDEKVKGVLFNIFGGITRGDEVAKGIVEGSRKLTRKVPMVIRLAGTREEEGRAILNEAGYETAATMDDAARKIVELTRA
ncbi:MAG: ADP-forming succinate--CoA ligase subunit beta [Armatimonadetes bacterium]|nr:ADP-forming succinate--CoA ligase subunit beta [Armatimonadota bacterium]